MESAMLDVVPETPGEALRFESAQRAVHIHEIARLLRMIAMVAIFTIAAARISLATSIGPPLGVIDAPVVYGICLFASLMTFSHERSTRLHREDRVQAYAEYLTSHRQPA